MGLSRHEVLLKHAEKDRLEPILAFKDPQTWNFSCTQREIMNAGEMSCQQRTE